VGPRASLDRPSRQELNPDHPAGSLVSTLTELRQFRINKGLNISFSI